MKHLQSLQRDTWLDSLNQISNQIPSPAPATCSELLGPQGVGKKKSNITAAIKKKKKRICRKGFFHLELSWKDLDLSHVCYLLFICRCLSSGSQQTSDSPARPRNSSGDQHQTDPEHREQGQQGWNTCQLFRLLLILENIYIVQTPQCFNGLQNSS